MAMTGLRAAASALLALAFLGQLCAQEMTAVKPMAANAHPSFDVATIKHSDPDDGSRGFHTSGRNIFIENETMDDLISFAYGVHEKQIVDAPSWFGSERFDIKGIPDVEGMPSVAQYRR
jgi:hypothetical protein